MNISLAFDWMFRVEENIMKAEMKSGLKKKKKN